MSEIKLPVERIFFYGFAVLSILCQLAGYAGMRGGWIIAGICLTAVWVLSGIAKTQTTAFLALIATVGSAAAGIVLGFNGVLLIGSAAFGLAAWDLLLLDANAKDTWDTADRQAYRDSHLKTCLTGVIGGLVLALLGRQVKLQIPFVVMIGLVIAAVYLFGRVWEFFKKKG